MRTTVLCCTLALALLTAAAVWAEETAPEGALAEAPRMKIMPAPAQVIIDGDLTEWNQEGKLGPTTFDPDSIGDYSGTFYAMYDQDFLYLAAVIVQPHPPYNTFPDKGVGAWNGDDVIIRMSSDPARPWPMEGTRESLNHDPALFTANFWWNHLKQRTHWNGYHGMGGPMLPEEAWAGTEVAVKIAPAGEGYTSEIKVPWATINPEFHPKVGDRIAFTWEISISNANPAQPTRIFQIFANGGGSWGFTNVGMWGQAVFVGSTETL